jgi:hypothetical protein
MFFVSLAQIPNIFVFWDLVGIDRCLLTFLLDFRAPAITTSHIKMVVLIDMQMPAILNHITQWLSKKYIGFINAGCTKDYRHLHPFIDPLVCKSILQFAF